MLSSPGPKIVFAGGEGIVRSRSKPAAMAWIAAAILALAVAACGGSSNDKSSSSSPSAQPTALKKGTTIRLWVMNNGPQPVQDTQRIVTAFERQTGVNVKVELVGWDVQFDRIRNAAVSGGGPDVTQAGTTQGPFFAALNGFSAPNRPNQEIGGEGGGAPVPGGGPDVTQAGTTQVPFFAALNGFSDLNGRIKDIGGKGAYAPGIWETTQLAGKDGTYAIP